MRLELGVVALERLLLVGVGRRCGARVAVELVVALEGDVGPLLRRVHTAEVCAVKRL